MIDSLFDDMIYTSDEIHTPLNNRQHHTTFNPSAQDTNASHGAKYINCVPKIQVAPYANLSTNRNILLVPIDEVESIQQIQSSIQMLNGSKRLFYVNPYHLSILINDIMKTNGKYVYPMTFVNYLKQTLSITEKVNFNNELLLYLRIWSNQIRELANKNNITEYKYSLATTSDLTVNHKITYIGYKICCELLYYYKYVHNK